MAERVKVAQVVEVPPGTMRRVKADGRPLALYNVDGEFYATADECSHDIASLSQGELDGHVVTCPRHYAQFDVRTGRHLCFPAVRPIRSYPVIVEGDELFIELS